jgi:hypothetical protein
MGWELIFVPNIVAIFVVLVLFHVDNIGRQHSRVKTNSGSGERSFSHSE